MFESMVELFNEGAPVDLITLQNRLKEKDVPPEVSSLDFVRDIITTVPTSANVRSYANIVYEKSVLRKLIKGERGDCQYLLCGQRAAGADSGRYGENDIRPASRIETLVILCRSARWR